MTDKKKAPDDRWYKGKRHCTVVSRVSLFDTRVWIQFEDGTRRNVDIRQCWRWKNDNKPATQTKYCAFCLMQGIIQRATVEGRTEDDDWCYMCPRHFAQHGIELGPGKGKRINGGEK